VNIAGANERWKESPMRDVTIWLLVANTLAIVAMVAYRVMTRSSLVPARIPLRPALSEAHRSR
jgi:hypothetical protein